MEEMINKCPSCSTWCNAERETSSGTGALAGAATGAAAASFIPGIGTLIGGVIGGVTGAFMGETKSWNFICHNCGHTWICENEFEDESEQYNYELRIGNLLSKASSLTNSSRNEKSAYIKSLQFELTSEDLNETAKGALYDALAYSELTLLKDPNSASNTIQKSLDLYPADPITNAIAGMIYGVDKNSYNCYKTMRKLIKYNEIDKENPYTHFTEVQFKERFDILCTNYVKDFLDIPINNRRFLVIDDYYRCLPDSFVVLTLDNLPYNISFPSGHPRLHELYVVHPYKPNQYFPYSNYQLELFRDELNEFSWLMECLGAKAISYHEAELDEVSKETKSRNNIQGGAEFKGYSGNVSYENEADMFEYKKLSNEYFEAKKYNITPDTLPYIPKDLVWYPHRPQWHRNCESRKAGR